MRISSIIMTPLAFFGPSRSVHVSLGKLALFGMIMTTFFLFTSAYQFPGGASHYPNWAEAIIHGNTLPPGVAQREVGFPLLYILGGFPFTHSFIGITLILATFAVLISMLVYLCLEKTSPVLAYLMGLACIVTLSPYTYLKFFYPDEAYIFFNLLAVTFLIRFMQSENKFQLLYFFTLTALMASFTRTAGNFMFPVLLAAAYLTRRGSIKHYISCVLIFALGTGLYQWHRYEVFDMRHQTSIPSGKGMQILYATYLFLGDFGVKLTPDIGPNTKRLFDRMREELGTNVRQSPLIKQGLGDSPKEFMEKNFYAYTPEQLIEKISTKPNEEYYWNVIMGVDSNDQFFLNVAKEIMRAHPWYVVEYSMRNFYHAIFDPGFATTRYNTLGYGHEGNQFVPEEYGWGTHSEDPVEQYGSKAVNEMKYYPLDTAPRLVKHAFHNIAQSYKKYFDHYLHLTSLFIVIAWFAVCFNVLARFMPHKKFLQVVRQIGTDKLMIPTILASALFVYESLLTSLFCQPVYRYFHLTEPLRLVVTGCGILFATSLLAYYLRDRFTGRQFAGSFSTIQQYDFLEKYFANRRTLWIVLLVCLNLALFAWWTSSMISHTWN